VIDETDETPMTHDERLHAFAADLVLATQQQVEFLTVVERAHDEKLFPDGLSDADAELVHDLALTATVRVSWPDHEYVYGNTFEDGDPMDEIT
jgi:hypothetical protein